MRNTTATATTTRIVIQLNVAGLGDTSTVYYTCDAYETMQMLAQRTDGLQIIQYTSCILDGMWFCVHNLENARFKTERHML